MNCNCINEINMKLAEASGDPEAKLDCTYELPTLKPRLCLSYFYRPIKKDGTFMREKEGKLALSKCPFCGKNFNDNP